MQISSQGTIVAWFSAAMLTIGFMFQNDKLLILATACLIGIGTRAAIFRSQTRVLRKQVNAAVDPPVSASLDNVQVKFSITINNSSQFSTRIVSLHPALPPQLKATEIHRIGPERLSRGTTVEYLITVHPEMPGSFTISSLALKIEDRSTLLTEVLRLNCKWTVEVSPALTHAKVRIETTDPRRMGSGSDVAGVREAITMDDFRIIDWKTTARTGKFMAKEFYRESTPPAIIAIDKRVLVEGIRSKNNVLLTVAELLISFGPSTRIGLAIYDATDVDAYFTPTAGIRTLQQMVSALVNAANEDPRQPSEYMTRLYAELVNMVRGMRSTLILRPHRAIDVFAKNLLPYYESAVANHAMKLRKQGGFLALSMISAYPQSALVIVISSFRHDLSGLCEGAIVTTAAGHRVVISLISGRESLPPELSELREAGVLVVQGGGPELLSAVSNELQKAQRIKSRAVKTQ